MDSVDLHTLIIISRKEKSRPCYAKSPTLSNLYKKKTPHLERFKSFSFGEGFRMRILIRSFLHKMRRHFFSQRHYIWHIGVFCKSA